MNKIRKGDQVIVLTGRDKGKRGTVMSRVDDERIVGDRVVVEKVAMIKRHQKPTQKSPQGGIIDKEGTIHISNVALFDDKLGRGTRTRITQDGDTKIRVGVKSGTKFPNTGMT